MKVAMVTPFPAEPLRIVGGVAGVAKYLGDELAKYPDIHLTVVVPKGSNNSETVREQWGGVRVYRLARGGIWSFLPATLYDVLAGRRQVHRFVRRIGSDIVHFQDAAFLAANYGPRGVLTIHGISEKDALWDVGWGALRWLKWLLLKLTEDYGRRRIGNVILISDCVAKVLPEDASRKTWRIDNPIADSFFDVERRPERGRIFCCGRITPLKNTLGMIEAFGRIVREAPECRLRIAGTADSDYLKACRTRIRKDGLRARVEFLGNLSVAEVQHELSRANCFAQPSFQETAPLSISEAMAAGVPVVASAVGGIPGMIENGRTGLLVDPRDARGIGEAIASLLVDEPLARSMGLRAKTAARQRYMASSVARQTVAAYREMLDGCRA